MIEKIENINYLIYFLKIISIFLHFTVTSYCSNRKNMGTCTIKSNYDESLGEKVTITRPNKDDFLTTQMSAKDFSSTPISWKIVSVKKDPNLNESWLTRTETPVSDYTNNMNQREIEVFFLSIYDKMTKPKTKAYLISVNKIEDIVEKICWSKKWGYIVFDSKTCGTIHGHEATSLGIKLSKIEEKKSDVHYNLDHFKVGDTQCGDLVFISNYFKNTIKVFPKNDIESTIKSFCLPKETQKDIFLRSRNNYFTEYDITFNFYQSKHMTILSDIPIDLSQGLDFFCQKIHNFFGQELNEKLDEFSPESDETQSYQKESNNSSDESETEKLFSKYKKCRIPEIHCICIVEKIDHWEIVCGHNSNTYSLWRMKLEDLHLPKTSKLSWEKVETNTKKIWIK